MNLPRIASVNQWPESVGRYCLRVGHFQSLQKGSVYGKAQLFILDVLVSAYLGAWFFHGGGEASTEVVSHYYRP